ncbi:MAG: anti-sigma factor domain-containing protein [Patescibacteria group bacterium]
MYYVKNNQGGAVVIAIVILALIVIGGYFVYQQDSATPAEQPDTVMMDDTTPANDEMEKQVSGDDAMAMKNMEYAYSGVLTDVTIEQNVTRVDTGGNASGIAQADYSDGVYKLLATFENLPEPNGDDFYEGWIVRPEPFNFISTGPVEKVDGVYTNTYMSGADLTDYPVYVLTIEPNDGDPAPDEHVVEGMMKKIGDTMIKEDTEMMEGDDAEAMQKDESDSSAMMEKAPGTYEDYSESAFAAAADKKRVYFFHASWCPTCFIADKNFKDNVGDLPDGVSVFKTDYDDEDELKQKYGVTYQHTFVQVDAEGNVVAKWNGGGVDELIENIK